MIDLTLSTKDSHLGGGDGGGAPGGREEEVEDGEVGGAVAAEKADCRSEIALNHGLTAKEIVLISNIEKASKPSVWVVFQNNNVLEIPVTTEFLAILDEYKKN